MTDEKKEEKSVHSFLQGQVASHLRKLQHIDVLGYVRAEFYRAISTIKYDLIRMGYFSSEEVFKKFDALDAYPNHLNDIIEAMGFIEWHQARILNEKRIEQFEQAYKEKEAEGND